ncbi:MAG: DNA gyrase inhibitor YacG [Beijerinckiaceae bacterium]|jgi:hypothetical protein|nr:DNA gyrase inhibitor YacG [Beijerinckiaceae bacterium]
MGTPVEFPVRAASRTCPICSRPTAAAFKPFCSKRCADVDLNRWLTDRYAVPVEEGSDRPSADEGEHDEGSRRR